MKKKTTTRSQSEKQLQVKTRATCHHVTVCELIVSPVITAEAHAIGAHRHGAHNLCGRIEKGEAS